MWTCQKWPEDDGKISLELRVSYFKIPVLSTLSLPILHFCQVLDVLKWVLLSAQDGTIARSDDNF